MGLTNHATGRGAWDSGLTVVKRSPEDRVIALAGNPNVGKSTLFNGLTGMNQHTGNWPGKTVANAQGHCSAPAAATMCWWTCPVRIPCMAHSAEEEVARDFLCFAAAGRGGGGLRRHLSGAQPEPGAADPGADRRRSWSASI